MLLLVWTDVMEVIILSIIYLQRYVFQIEQKISRERKEKSFQDKIKSIFNSF